MFNHMNKKEQSCLCILILLLTGFLVITDKVISVVYFKKSKTRLQTHGYFVFVNFEWIIVVFVAQQYI